ncbi:hypothetical protein KJ765_02610 [Candidatus Micrarchaeota archaeon]|nr:hypothetical protein [Candidatus Micrarchaeota archaeon]
MPIKKLYHKPVEFFRQDPYGAGQPQKDVVVVCLAGDRSSQISRELNAHFTKQGHNVRARYLPISSAIYSHRDRIWPDIGNPNVIIGPLPKKRTPENGREFKRKKKKPGMYKNYPEFVLSHPEIPYLFFVDRPGFFSVRDASGYKDPKLLVKEIIRALKKQGKLQVSTKRNGNRNG